MTDASVIQVPTLTNTPTHPIIILATDSFLDIKAALYFSSQSLFSGKLI